MSEMTAGDRYSKLRERARTPAEDLCRCSDHPPVKLMSALSFNPVHCMRCNLEVAPESLPVPEELVDPLANWQWVFGALDALWLDSNEYADWAAREMSNLAGSINRRGLKLRADLERVRRCYYWWCQDSSGEAFEPAVQCPVCAEQMILWEDSSITQVVCESCRLVTAGD